MVGRKNRATDKNAAFQWADHDDDHDFDQLTMMMLTMMVMTIMMLTMTMMMMMISIMRIESTVTGSRCGPFREKTNFAWFQSSNDSL